MGLFTFGKKTKASKNTTAQNNPLKSISKASSEDSAKVPCLPGKDQEKEKELAGLLVGDVDLPLAMTPSREEPSLLEDILIELTGQSDDQKFQLQDELHSNASTALQLASKLEFSFNEKASRRVGSNASSPTVESDHSDRSIDRNVYRGLFGADSIYSATSITGCSHTTKAATVNITTSPKQEELKAKGKFVVLDSDVSDSGESDISDESNDEYRDNYKVSGKPQDIIMNRRKQHSATEEANKQAMIDRMKERHRLEARTAVLRSQTRKQNHLTSSSRFHSMQAVPTTKAVLVSNTALPINYPSQTFKTSIPLSYSMQGISAKLDEQDSVAMLHQFNEVNQSNLPCQTFIRVPNPLMAAASYSPVANGSSYNDFGQEVRPTTSSKHRKPRNLNIEQPRDKLKAKDGLLRKSRSFTNDHPKKRFTDADFPPLPDSPMSEPGFSNNMYIRSPDGRGDGRLSSHKEKESNRISSNNSSSTEESDAPHMPHTPSDTFDQLSQLKINRQPDIGSPMDCRSIRTSSGLKAGIKHAKSESNLRRHLNPVPYYEEKEDDDGQHVAALNEDCELKWHYKCYRQQDVYTSFADYLAAIQYQKLMRRQQQMMYKPFHQAMHANAHNFF